MKTAIRLYMASPEGERLYSINQSMLKAILLNEEMRYEAGSRDVMAQMASSVRNSS
jgi:hypothetical protein